MVIADADQTYFPFLTRWYQTILSLKTKTALLLAFCSGMIANLAYAPLHIWPALLVSMVLLIWLLDGGRKKPNWGRAMFCRAWAWGLGFFIIGLHWAVFPFLVQPEKHLVFVWLPLLVMPSGLALFWGIAGLICGVFWKDKPGRIIVFALVATFTEWVRGHIFGGFCWNTPGVSWAAGGAISQLASVFGIWGLTFFSILFFCVPATLACSSPYNNRRGLFLTIFVLTLAGLSWGFGAKRISQPADMTNIHVKIVDAGAPQNEKQLYATKLFRRYLELTGSAEKASEQIVIWPEGALPVPLLQSPDILDAISAYLGDRILIVGTLRYEKTENTQIKWYNSLAILDANSSQRGALAIYDKHKLVPFGELPPARFIPFGQKLSEFLPPALQQMAVNGMYTGPSPSPIILDGLPPLLPLICYEALFPRLVKNGYENADWIVNISNDAWFGSGFGPIQHVAQIKYRAIESGLPITRAASRGKSLVIDSYGREIFVNNDTSRKIDHWKSVIVNAPLPQSLKTTIYARFIELIFYVTIILFIFLAVFFNR